MRVVINNPRELWGYYTVYDDLGTDYYERRADIARRARAIERRGYKVTIEPLSPDPETVELPVTKAS